MEILYCCNCRETSVVMVLLFFCKVIIRFILYYSLSFFLRHSFTTTWNIREEDYGNHILTDDIEIELPKVEKYKKGLALDHWVEFIKNPKVINMSNKEIKKAKDVLEQISQDETERHLAELRLKHIRDQKAIEAAGFRL